MSDKSIGDMNFKELKNEVQLLRDELAIFKRKYEDAIYNLDSDNFGKSFTLEQNNMKAQIKITANALKTTVSKNELESALNNYSTISQTAEKIEATVTKSYVENLIGNDYITNAVLTSKIEQSSAEIHASVSAQYETKDDAQASYSSLTGSIAEITLNSDSISTRVSDLEGFKTSVFTQTADGFTLDGESTTFTGVIFLTDNNGNKRFSLFHDETQGYEQILIGSSGDGTGLPITIGKPNDTLYFNDCASITWGKNAPEAVFG